MHDVSIVLSTSLEAGGHHRAVLRTPAAPGLAVRARTIAHCSTPARTRAPAARPQRLRAGTDAVAEEAVSPGADVDGPGADVDGPGADVDGPASGADVDGSGADVRDPRQANPSHIEDGLV